MAKGGGVRPCCCRATALMIASSSSAGGTLSTEAAAPRGPRVSATVADKVAAYNPTNVTQDVQRAMWSPDGQSFSVPR
jgi:hypothetical protein